MRIVLIAVGQRMSDWVDTGFAEYAKRLPHQSRLELVTVPAGKRAKNTDSQRLIEQEGEKMLASIPAGAHVIAMDTQGKPLNTEQWSQRLEQWMQQGRDVAFLVGGPEGLAGSCLRRADESWSLSALTFPHPLVRIIIAEQLYRASSILQGHPYHK